ncbi:MAG: penicillin-binding protein 2 [Clostridium sp.]|nr:penicillin-binding protein 2 [Clostridium sp.]
MFFIFVPTYARRIKYLLFVFTAILFLLSIRLFELQIYPSKNVVSSCKSNQTEKISDYKLKVLDSNGQDLCTYSEKYILVIDKKPFLLNNYEETLEDLMTLNFIAKGENSNFSFEDVMKAVGKVYYDISEEAYNKINLLINIKGIYTYKYEEENKDYAWTLSNMITNSIGKDEVDSDSFESKIRKIVKDNEEVKENFYLNDRYIYDINARKVVNNNKNIKLTIDKTLNDKAKEVLNREEYKGYKNIGVMLMEADTGKIRVMTQKDESEANINLSVESLGYEPGSIYKLITAAAALDKGLVSMQSEFNCTGVICKKKEIHGRLSLNNALVKSCNDCLAEAGKLVGYDALMDYSEKCGLFSRVLNIQGEGRAESKGLKPEEEKGLNNISIGQCITATPIQMLGAINTIVNDGIYIKPYIIDGVVDKDNNVIESFESDKTYKVFDEIACKLLKKTMVEVVNKGTGILAKVNNKVIGGKTGSATTGDKNTHGWFAGFFENNNKLYTMTVFVPDIAGEDSKNIDLGGGDTAAPIFREIVKSISS